MNVELSHRLADAVGLHVALPDERLAIQDAAQSSITWADLPVEIRALVVEIESRPAP